MSFYGFFGSKGFGKKRKHLRLAVNLIQKKLLSSISKGTLRP